MCHDDGRRGVGSGAGDPGAGDPPALLHGDEQAQPPWDSRPRCAAGRSKCTRCDGNTRSLRKSLVGIGPQFEPVVAPVEDIMQRLARMAAAYGIVEQPAQPLLCGVETHRARLLPYPQTPPGGYGFSGHPRVQERMCKQLACTRGLDLQQWRPSKGALLSSRTSRRWFPVAAAPHACRVPSTRKLVGTCEF
ncbi:hypothetical protein BJ912DRAFT_921894 [Pholiota molesta]|nr:hypothetical protein BJ912DRAFT_921894 [Pholiota molesta]